MFYANKTHTAAKSKAPSIAVAEVEIDVPIEVGSSSPIQAEMTDISFDGVERNVLSNTATVVLHNDSDSADHQWDNIASIGANGKNAVPIGGSKDIKTPWNSSAPVVKPVVGHCVPRRVQFITGGADFSMTYLPMTRLDQMGGHLICRVHFIFERIAQRLHNCFIRRRPIDLVQQLQLDPRDA